MSSTLAIIVSYNDAANTLRCVESLKNQARVVVWDNASTDGTVDQLTWKHPDVEVHANDHNALWTPALNGAMEKFYNGEDYILFSNNDIVYQPDTVARLIGGFSNRDAGIVAPAGSGLGGQQDFATHHPFPRGQYSQNWVNQQPTIRVAFVVGASMMVSSACWDDVGPLDNQMPLGADDHDFCIRAKEKGWTIWVVNSAYINHQSHASARQAKDVWSEYGQKSWDAFNEKWDGYFYDEEEAIKVHWGDRYNPGWDYGTGWLTAEARAAVYRGRDDAT